MWSGIVRCLGICGILVGLVGCGGGADTPDLGDVSGTILLDGKPLADASVEFTPANGRGSVAVTDSQGRYTLRYTNDADGAVLGAHTVRISTGRAGTGSNEGGESTAAVPERVPPKYNSATDIKVEVKAGSNTFDYKIEGGGQTFPTIGEGRTKAPTA